MPNFTFFIAIISFFISGCVALANETEGFEKVQIGQFKSRGLWHKTAERAPVVIMIPGSGANGPEEMIPGDLTVDNKPAALFLQFAKPFVEKGYNVLLLGKPGVEFFKTFEHADRFYDINLFKNLKWHDLISNLHAGVEFVKSQASVDKQKIVILGHSEGTQIASDYLAAEGKNLHAGILLGYTAENMKTLIDWQIVDRLLEHFVATDVDTNHDGIVTALEDEANADFTWGWKAGQTQINYAEMIATRRADPEIKAYLKAFEDHPLYSNGIFSRPPLTEQTASLAPTVYAINGSLDLQTRAKNVTELAEACARRKKLNCFAEIIPGLGHGFSPPRPPRSHPLLDITVGPAEQRFLSRLREIAETLKAGR